MRGDPDVHIKGKKTQFSKSRQPSKKGRKPNQIKVLKKQFNLSSDDVNFIIEKQLLMTQAELKELISNPKSTVIEISFGMALFSGMRRGDLTAVEIMLNRKLGKDDGGTDLPAESVTRLTEIFEQGTKETKNKITVTMEQTTTMKSKKHKLIDVTPERVE